ncbi:glycogen debranching enzyme [Pseudarthrobacter sp. W1I19]|uniref:amylo-alpha-1,6-glucosidase n=1 Tax=Pseudarthrobacter sp. W1I19 TaxID=3042288 RepID=UPI0027829428|nr:glycogen debranching N-terminal domain-containing protein [Pseudarthrobacter sp. W1I19]MDQ0925636.1 glycogen debranching enzyme [Pseudarthrobacter sp. W1I19]
MSGWNAANAAGRMAPGAVTLLEGASFCISSANGDIDPGSPQGAFFNDTRFIGEWNLTVNGSPIEALSAVTPDPYRARFIGRVPATANAESTLLVERERSLEHGLTERVIVRNHSRVEAACRLVLVVDTDFADLFEVKEGRVSRSWTQSRRSEGDNLILESKWNGRSQGLVVTCKDAQVQGRGLAADLVVPAHGERAWTISATPHSGMAATANSASEGTKHGQTLNLVTDAEPSASIRRITEWRTAMPVADLGDDAVERVIRRSQEDLGSLRIFDSAHPDRVVVAAGAPWFMALFGRDSLFASYMSLLLDPSLALGTLRTLAEYQGRAVNPLTEEEPGRILHEVRLGVSTAEDLAGSGIYYGTADATPLFVAGLGELNRWGLEAEAVQELLPAADKALEWMENYGDRDGDGFIEYKRHTEQGLRNQGWKDSWDGINFADGSLAEPPIALCEVQAYSYSAYLGRALIALTNGDTAMAERCSAKAHALKRAFNDRFWLPDRGYFAVALDGDKRPVDSLASNMGHCLWTGIIDEDKAASVVEHLMSPEMFTGWGIRTLASSMGAYNPASYHNGSVWPHDTTLAAAGMMRYGFVEQAQKVAYALLEAADYFGGRLPELFCGLDRRSYPVPVPYPASCSPQAWASAAPVHLIRLLLRFDPILIWNELWLAPALPPGTHFRLDNVPFAGQARISLDVDMRNDSVQVHGLPKHVGLRLGGRPPLSELFDITGSRRSHTASRGKTPEPGLDGQ